jgi:hypothetical protein
MYECADLLIEEAMFFPEPFWSVTLLDASLTAPLM